MEYNPVIVWLANLPNWAGYLIMYGSAILTVAVPFILYKLIIPQHKY